MKHDNVEYRGDLRNDDEDDETLSSSSAVKQVMGGGDNLNRQLTSLKDQNKETKTPPQSIACQSRASVSLSKSWREVTAHCTSYDGGKIVMCHGRGTRNLYGIKPGAVKNSLVDNAVKKSGVNIDHHTDGKIDTQVEHQENHTERTYVPFFVAMCEGDLVLIDATRGVKARSIRRGVAISAGAEVALQNKYEDDYDEVN